MNLTYSRLIEDLNEHRPKGLSTFFMPFSDAHLDRMEITQPEIVSASKFVDIKAAVAAQSRIGYSFTAFLDDNPVVCFGVIPIWNGVAEAWFIADDIARGKPKSLSKVAKHFLDIFEISLGLHRLQITVRNSDIRALKWAAFLGFTEEGVMLNYGPDSSNFSMMARYR